MKPRTAGVSTARSGSRRTIRRSSRRNTPRPGVGERAQLIAAVRLFVDVVPRAEEGEMIVLQPLQEGEGLVDLLARRLRRMLPELGDRLIEPRQHRPPIGDGGLDLREHARDAGLDIGELIARLRARERDADHALGDTVFVGLEGEPAKCAARVALDAHDRMEDRLHRKAAIGKLGQDRIDQERLVVVDRRQKARRRGEAVLLRRRVEHAQERRADAPLLHGAPEQPRQSRERVLRERLQIVRRRAGVKAQRELRKALRIGFERSSDHDVSREDAKVA